MPSGYGELRLSFLDGADRTNNQCESWNSSFCHLLGYTKHPSLFVLIEYLQRDQSLAATTILQCARSHPPTKRVKRATVALQQRLVKLCIERRDNIKTVAETLRAIGHSI